MIGKIWFNVTLTAILLLLAIVFGINYLCDPMACTGKIQADRIYPVIDERQQKTNYLIDHQSNYQNLILGSSRVSYIESRGRLKKFYNYACSGMYPAELVGYIQNAQVIMGQVDTVFVGLDFWTTCQAAIVVYEKPDSYLKKAKSPYYCINTYFSMKMLRNSWDVYKIREKTAASNTAYYNIRMFKRRVEMEGEMKEDNLKTQLAYYKKDVFGAKYHYSEDYLRDISHLKLQYPKVHFVVMTTPVSPELWQLIESENRIPDFERWINELESVFGNVYQRTDPVQNHANSNDFYDAHHMKPTPLTELAVAVIKAEKNRLEH